MSINFCNEGLVIGINSDKISLDNHDVTNLISLDSSVRKRGFLVSNFITPPVTINLTFPCNVDVKHVKIDGRVGVQKSSNFSIFTWKTGSCKETFVASGQLDRGENVLEFHIYGKNGNKGVAFRSSRELNGIIKLTIRIDRTEGSSLPALGKLEIWGFVSRYVEKELAKSIYLSWNKIKHKSEPVQIQKNLPPNVEGTVQSASAQISNHVVIPEEFIDPITCELMTIPMTLPSGKTVDASTLEKFHEAEKEFGRGKSDPYTGILFTDFNKPILSTNLKARMDRFLLENSCVPELSTAPRALGKKREMPSYASITVHNVEVATTSTGKKRTIDQLLDSSLSGLPSFLERPKPKEVKTQCFKCSSEKVLFKLSCEDIICRNCLCEMKSGKLEFCDKCKKPIDYNNVSRYHIGEYF